MVARRKRGFTLVEILLAMGLLSLLSIGLFSAFDYGATAFRHATSQQENQGALTRAYTTLRDDLRQTHFRSVSVKQRTVEVEGEHLSRDGLCFGGLKDWDAEESFDAVNGLPKWDRYLLYYATQKGLLVRSEIDPAFPDFSPAPFGSLDETEHMQEDPAFNAGNQIAYKIVTNTVKEFAVELDPGSDTVLVSCVLKLRHRDRTDLTEFELEISPQNTWPRGDQ
jgi:prepilin-type N-terminal cleavage/methylation domain-containing protein